MKIKKISQGEAKAKSKFGVDFLVYDTELPELGFVHEESAKGHLEEFYNKTSTFIYYILAGEGKFFLNGVETPVKEADLLIIPPNTKIYYLGQIKLTLLTIPAWQAADEVHVRNIDAG